jgi:hypothetical protein
MRKVIIAGVIGVLTWQVAAAMYAAIMKIQPVTKYVDGTPIETTKQVVYSIYDADTNKMLATSFSLSVAKSLDDAVKCVYVRAGIYDAAANTTVTGTMSDPSPVCCKKIAPPVVKQLAPPAGIEIQ